MEDRFFSCETCGNLVMMLIASGVTPVCCGEEMTELVAKSADEAARVMVYKNGEPCIYGKGKYNNREEAETDCTKFVDDTTVMTTRCENFKVDDVDKYTIVIWIEGNDPECVDDIRNGHIRMRMLFSVEDEETTK